MSESFVLVGTRGPVGLLTLNRPKARNARNDKMFVLRGAALLAVEGNPHKGWGVINGSEKAVSAGAVLAPSLKSTSRK